MKYIGFIAFVSVVASAFSALGASLLQQQSFPTGASDLNFIQKVSLEQAGYVPWESEYDSNGRCISGCAYQGITIQEDMARSNERTAAAWQQAQQYLASQRQLQQVQNTANMQTNDAKQIAQAISVFTNGYNQQTPTQTITCNPRNSHIPVGQTVPFGGPLSGATRITSGYGLRTHPVTGQKSSAHWAVDLSAPVGTNVFSPASGTVSSVWTDSSCGNGLSIRHSDGYETFYCHLSKTTVRKGDKVDAGCKVAETGNTGRTTGPHLHYAIKKNGDVIDPTQWILTNS